MTTNPRATRDRHRRVRALNRKRGMRTLFARRVQREIDDRLSDDEYLDAVKQKLHVIHTWLPDKAAGVKPRPGQKHISKRRN